MARSTRSGAMASTSGSSARPGPAGCIPQDGQHAAARVSVGGAEGSPADAHAGGRPSARRRGGGCVRAPGSEGHAGHVGQRPAHRGAEVHQGVVPVGGPRGRGERVGTRLLVTGRAALAAAPPSSTRPEHPTGVHIQRGDRHPERGGRDGTRRVRTDARQRLELRHGAGHLARRGARPCGGRRRAAPRPARVAQAAPGAEELARWSPWRAPGRRGSRARNAGSASPTRPIWVCWDIASPIQMAYPSRGSRMTSRRPCACVPGQRCGDQPGLSGARRTYHRPVIDPLPLPSADPFLVAPGPDLDALAAHWAPLAARVPISGEAMRGIDARAQRLGVPGETLMEEAGRAAAAVALAMLGGRRGPATGLVLVLAGPGQQRRRRPRGGAPPGGRRGPQRGRARVHRRRGRRPATRPLNWDRLDGIAGVERIHAGDRPRAAAAAQRHRARGAGHRRVAGHRRPGHAPRAHPVRRWRCASGRAGRGCARPRRGHADRGRPDAAARRPTPSSGPTSPSRSTDPRTGLIDARRGARLAGRVLVAPIGIPTDADRS